MRRRDLFLGPPGTGKTTRLLREIDGLQADGFELFEIGFVSFTRRAIQEARERGAAAFGCGPEDVPWFRTMHSSFAQACGMSNWMKAADYRQFRDEHGYELTPDGGGDTLEHGASFACAKTEDDKLLAANDYARSRRGSLDEAAAKSGVHVERLKAFSEAYKRFKFRAGKSDFTDILEQAVARGVRLPVRAIIVDEAQDLSPLQILAIAPTIEAADVAIVAGDDDQAIFTFQGSEPDWLIRLSRDTAWRTEVLSQSWRVPRAVHAMAQCIIARNQNRVRKLYAARPEDGEVMRGVDDVAELLGRVGPAAYLARTRAGTKDVADELFQRAVVPYIVQRGMGPNPLGKPAVMEAVNTSWRMSQGEEVSRAAVVGMLELVPSRHPLALLPHGTKAKVERHPSPTVTPDDVIALGLGRLREVARSDGHCAVLLKLEATDRAWFRAMWGRHGRIPEPEVVLSTIHSTKGAEWPTVVVSPDHNWLVEQSLTSPYEREAEHRVAYVGVTRAKERLVIARQRGRHGDVPSLKTLHSVYQV